MGSQPKVASMDGLAHLTHLALVCQTPSVRLRVITKTAGKKILIKKKIVGLQVEMLNGLIFLDSNSSKLGNQLGPFLNRPITTLIELMDNYKLSLRNRHVE